MARRVMQITFIAAVAIVCFSAIAGIAITGIFPDSRLYNNQLDAGSTPTNDEGLVSTAQILADPIGELLNGNIAAKFENQITTRFENSIKEYIPARDELLLTSAKTNRMGIAFSNLLFGYDALPTFYGSGYLFYPSFGAVYMAPNELTSENEEVAETMLTNYRELITDNPQICWCFYVADWCTTFNGNEARDLTSNSATYDQCFQALKAALPADTAIVYDGYADAEEYVKYHYRTDHHWNIEGALRGYEAIMNALGLSHNQGKIGAIVNACDTGFYGSCTSGGLITDYEDSFEDVVFPMDNLTIAINGNLVEPSELDYYNGTGEVYSKSSRFDNPYSSAFHNVGDRVEIENSECAEGTLLIVADSYSIPMERFFSTNFHKVIAFDPRYSEMSIYDYISQYNPDTVVSIQRCDNIYKDNFLSIFNSDTPASTEKAG